MATPQETIQQIKHVLHQPNVSLNLVNTLIGPEPRGIQVMIGRRKIGPILYPEEGKGLKDLLSTLGEWADAPEEVQE